VSHWKYACFIEADARMDASELQTGFCHISRALESAIGDQGLRLFSRRVHPGFDWIFPAER
jgi:hypothetical protein